MPGVLVVDDEADMRLLVEAVIKRANEGLKVVGLATNGADPEQASCYFSVSDVEALRRELDARGIEPSPVSVQKHEGREYRIFFAKEPYGVCFCFGEPA